MTDFTKHSAVLSGLQAAQEADGDQREFSREAHHFIDKRDGQWEQEYYDRCNGKPRYTFDQTGPVVDQIAGEMELADFDITIKPAGGDATKDDAMLIDGIVRNIENVSNASDIYNMAGRSMITGGLDGWQIVHDYVDDDSFDQDLIIKPIANFIDSVYFWPFKLPDASDAPACVVLEAIPKDAYEKRWPKGSGNSVDESRMSSVYFNKVEHVIVGQLYYIETVNRKLLLTSRGRTFEAESVAAVLDEMAATGETIINERMRPKNIVYSRLFDGDDWLNDKQKTVFNQIPVIPTMGNFKISENKIIYRGVVEKMMDPQRIFNYSKSREVEENALAPRAKFWMTLKQMLGFESELATLNTNADPVQGYNHDPQAPGPPQQSGGAMVNPGLKTLSDDMDVTMSKTAGLFAPNMGDNPGLQSGIAIKRLQDKGDTSTIKYFSSQERAICRTGRILVDAIPVVYDTARQSRIMKEDGSFDMKTLNEQIMDQQTQRLVTINDVSRGTYDVTCSSGPSFQNRQQETVAAFTEMMAIDPNIVATGGDILFNNVNSPGMDQIGERLRLQIFNAGGIPPDQMTEDEQQQTQAAQQQEPPPDPLMIAAQAEAGKAEAQQQKVIVDMQIAQSKEQRENFKAQQAQQQQQFDQAMKLQQGAVNELTAQADTLKTIIESIGPGAIAAAQGTIVAGTQQEQ